MTMPRIAAVLIAVLAAVSLGFMGPKQDQEDTLRIEIVRSNLRIPIAIPDFESAGIGEPYNSAAREIAQIVREDLRRVEIFNLADQVVYSQIGRHAQTAIPWDQYATYKMDALLLGRVVPDGGNLKVEARLFSVRDKSSLYGKRVTGRTDQIRYIAHTISNDILYHFTGSFGIFKTRIVYSSTRDVKNPQTQKEIWIMDWDGHNHRQVTYSDSLKEFPVIGPGDSGIAYTSFINNNADVYHLSLTGGPAQKVFASRTADMAPAISPDGTRIAFTSSVDAGNFDIYVSNLDGSAMQRLTNNRAIDSSPCWSPDGRRIAFTSNRTGTVQIYTMNADGSSQERITFEGTYNDGADWSPDGRYIAYASRRDRSLTFDIKIHDLTTNQTYWVTRDVANDENPCFSPDGRSIAFQSDRTGTYQVFSIDIDGRNMRQLTTIGINKHPSWSR